MSSIFFAFLDFSEIYSILTLQQKKELFMFIISFFVKIFKLIWGIFGLIRRFFRLISAILILICLVGLGVAVYSNFVVNSYSEKVYHRIEDVGKADYALLLGCAEKVDGSVENKYFRARVDAAAELYRKGCVKKILISGDNSRKDYDETSAMRAALLAQQIPPEALVMDYAGFRTLDSILRARDVFGVRNMIIVTQEYHACRALFIAQENGISATAFAAGENVSVKTKFFNHGREWLARLGAWVDVKILDRKPRFPR